MKRIAPRRLIVGLAALVCGGAVLAAFGIGGLQDVHRATGNPHPVVPSGVVTFSAPVPDETPPGAACEAYEVPADEPRFIQLPEIGRSGCILRVGVDQYDSIAVPSNIHLAGWFIDSAAPGEKGVSIIDGHVSGVYGEAIFTGLADLVPGDLVTVELGDGRERAFTVISVEHYTVAQTAGEQFRQLEDVERQLTLITCGGSFDPVTGLFADRVVVRAGALP